MDIEPTDALLVIDVQNDFLPGGSLAVADGRRVLAPINAMMPRFATVIATRDWHPFEHRFFARYGGPWPDHCLAGTAGAAFDRELDVAHIDLVIDKGTDPQTDGYSGFAETGLTQTLRAKGVRRVVICGLATDYCVKATALDAIAAGFDAVVVTDAIAAVNVDAHDEARALDAMRAAGARFAASSEIVGATAANHPG